MDSLTHTVLGACMGEAIAGKQLGKKAMLIGAIAHNFPDIDVIFNFFTTPANSLLTHRGITHSILFNVLFTFVALLICKRVFKNNSMTNKRWLALISSGLFTHIIIDAFTTYGTGWFEPFNTARVSFNTLFILDPFLMLPLLVVAIALLVMKRDSPKRQGWAKASLVISVLYLSLCIFDKVKVNNVVAKNIELQQLPADEYMSAPTPLNNFLWYVVAKRDDNFYIAYYSVFDRNKTLNFEYFNRNDSILDNVRNDEEVQKMIRFSKGYYHIHREDSAIIFSDTRFGQTGGWEIKQAPFVFNYDISRTTDNRVALQRGRFKDVKGDVFGKLIERIKGN